MRQPGTTYLAAVLCKHRRRTGSAVVKACLLYTSLAKPPREVGVKVPQRQVNEMGDRRLSHIRRHPEGCKMRAHEAGEIDRCAQKRCRQRVPAVAGKPCRNAASRRQNASGRVPDKDERENADRRRNAGQPAAQYGQPLMPSGVFQQPAQHRRLRCV